MKTFFWIILSTLLVGLLGRINVGGAGILPTDILIPLFLVTWIGKKIIQQQPFIAFPFGQSLRLFLFLAWLSFLYGSWDLSLKEQFVSGAYWLRLIGLVGFGWAALDIMKTTDPKKFWTPFFGIVGGVLSLGVIQFYVLPDIATYSTEGGWDPHTGRLLGTWLDPNYLAGFFGLVLPFAITQWYYTTTKKQVFWYSILIIGLLAGLFLTFSRSGYLAAGIGLFFYFWHKDWRIILLGVIIVSLGILTNQRAQKRVTALVGTMANVLLQQTDEIDPTASLRIQNWRKSFVLFEKNPLLGVGYNTYRYKAAEEGIVDENFFSAGAADSTHLTILVTTGIIGFLVYLWWIIALFLERFLVYRHTKLISPEKSYQSLAFCAGFLSLLIHSSFVNSLFFPLIFITFVTLYAVIKTEKIS